MCDFYMMKRENYESDPSNQIPKTHYQGITIFKGEGRGMDGMARKYAIQLPY